jgi:hypothetical protein
METATRNRLSCRTMDGAAAAVTGVENLSMQLLIFRSESNAEDLR